jgi:hypothetical protein
LALNAAASTNCRDGAASASVIALNDDLVTKVMGVAAVPAATSKTGCMLPSLLDKTVFATVPAHAPAPAERN